MKSSFDKNVQSKVNNTTHTPTPWKYNEALNTIQDSNYGIAEMIDRRITMTKQEGINLSKANAAFIVRAVNSHEALLEAAKSGRDMFWANTSEAQKEELMRKYPDHPIVAIEKAIARAEGGK